MHILISPNSKRIRFATDDEDEDAALLPKNSFPDDSLGFGDRILYNGIVYVVDSITDIIVHVIRVRSQAISIESEKFRDVFDLTDTRDLKFTDVVRKVSGGNERVIASFKLVLCSGLPNTTKSTVLCAGLPNTTKSTSKKKAIKENGKGTVLYSLDGKHAYVRFNDIPILGQVYQKGASCSVCTPEEGKSKDPKKKKAQLVCITCTLMITAPKLTYVHDYEECKADHERGVQKIRKRKREEEEEEEEEEAEDDDDEGNELDGLMYILNSSASLAVAVTSSLADAVLADAVTEAEDVLATEAAKADFLRIVASIMESFHVEEKEKIVIAEKAQVIFMKLKQFCC